MQSATVLKPLLSQLWWLCPLLVAAVISRTSWFKGLWGEFLVSLATRFLLDPKEYIAVHNVTLPAPDGTTQIDHVYISRFGVFVVETKNYSGWIFGEENQAQWTQKLFKKTNKFLNPLRQNYKHIKALEAATGLASEKFHSVVVFVGGSKFKTSMPLNVTQAGGLINFIKSKKQTLLDDKDISEVISRLNTKRLKPNITTNREHIKNIKNRLRNDADRKCPKCGLALVKSTVKYGDNAGNEFWGCIGFPKCRAVQKIT